jgi:hypothetical protein
VRLPLLVSLLMFLPPQGGSHASAQERNAPIDLRGTWVSVVTEEWHLRMITPPRGNFEGMTINDAARTIASAWDPARDEAAGDTCKAYGAANLMRLPGRVRFSWQDNGRTLRLEADAGQQTRLLQFGDAPARANRTLQGQSSATWETADKGGRLKVVTTHLRPGYLRKNGVPYSEQATVTEYFNLMTDPNGGDWLVVTTIVSDPVYLLRDYVTSSNFRKEADGSRWRPRPCSAR